MKSKYVVWIPIIGVVAAPLVMIKERATIESIGAVNLVLSAFFQGACIVGLDYYIFLR